MNRQDWIALITACLESKDMDWTRLVREIIDAEYMGLKEAVDFAHTELTKLSFNSNTSITIARRANELLKGMPSGK